MERIIYSKYKVKSKDNLKDLGFNYDEKTEVYTYIFPIWKYKNTPTLKCMLSIGDSKVVKIDVIHVGSGEYYTPFYGCRFGNYSEFMEKLDKRILNEFKKLGIRKVTK